MENNPLGIWSPREGDQPQKQQSRPSNPQSANPQNTNIAHSHAHATIDHDPSGIPSFDAYQHSMNSQKPAQADNSRQRASSPQIDLLNYARELNGFVVDIHGIRASTLIQAQQRAQPQAQPQAPTERQIEDAKMEELLKNLQDNPVINPLTPEYRTPYNPIPPPEANRNSINSIMHHFIMTVVPSDKPSPFNIDIFVENPNYSQDLARKRVQVSECYAQANPHWSSEDTMVMAETKKHQPHTVLSAEHTVAFSDRSMLTGFCTIATRKYTSTWTGPQRDEDGKLIDKADIPNPKGRKNEEEVDDVVWKYSVLISAAINGKTYAYEVLIPTRIVKLDGVEIELLPEWVDAVNALRKLASQWGAEWGMPALEPLKSSLENLPQTALEGTVQQPTPGQEVPNQRKHMISSNIQPSPPEISVQRRVQGNSPAGDSPPQSLVQNDACSASPELERDVQERILEQKLLIQQNGSILNRQLRPSLQRVSEGRMQGNFLDQERAVEQNESILHRSQSPSTQNRFEGHVQRPITSVGLQTKEVLSPQLECFYPPNLPSAAEVHTREPIAQQLPAQQENWILNKLHSATPQLSALLSIEGKSPPQVHVQKVFPQSLSPPTENGDSSVPTANSLQIPVIAELIPGVNLEAPLPAEEAPKPKRRGRPPNKGNTPKKAAVPKKEATPRKPAASKQSATPRKSAKQKSQLPETPGANQQSAEPGSNILDGQLPEGQDQEIAQPKSTGKRRRNTTSGPSKRQKTAKNELEEPNGFEALDRDPFTNMPITNMGQDRSGTQKPHHQPATAAQLPIDPRLGFGAFQDNPDGTNQLDLFQLTLPSTDPWDYMPDPRLRPRFMKDRSRQEEQEFMIQERAAWIVKKRAANPNYDPANDSFMQRQYEGGPDPDALRKQAIFKELSGLGDEDYNRLFVKIPPYAGEYRNMAANQNMGQGQAKVGAEKQIQNRGTVSAPDMIPNQIMGRGQNGPPNLAPLEGSLKGWDLLPDGRVILAHNSEPNRNLGRGMNMGGYQNQAPSQNPMQGFNMGGYQNQPASQNPLQGINMGGYQSQAPNQSPAQGFNMGGYQNQAPNPASISQNQMQGQGAGNFQNPAMPQQNPVPRQQPMPLSQPMPQVQNQPQSQMRVPHPQNMAPNPNMQRFQNMGMGQQKSYDLEEIAFFGKLGERHSMATLLRQRGFDFSSNGNRSSMAGQQPFNPALKNQIRAYLQKRLQILSPGGVSRGLVEKWLVELDGGGQGGGNGGNEYPSPSLR